MKLFITLVLLTCESFLYVQGNRAEILRALDVHKETCMRETNVNREYVKRLIENREFSEDRHFKCYLKCLLEKIDIISKESGEFNEEMIEELTSREDVERCRVEKREDSCEAAFVFVRCFLS